MTLTPVQNARDRREKPRTPHMGHNSLLHAPFISLQRRETGKEERSESTNRRLPQKAHEEGVSKGSKVRGTKRTTNQENAGLRSKRRGRGLSWREGLLDKERKRRKGGKGVSKVPGRVNGSACKISRRRAVH